MYAALHAYGTDTTPFLSLHCLQEEEQLIRPAVFGTENVINAVNAAGTVRRVVVTASTAAVFTDAFERGKGHVFTEADWNISATPKKFPYFYSKALAEQVNLHQAAFNNSTTTHQIAGVGW